MLCYHPFLTAFIVLNVCGIQYVEAQTSLYIPGFEPQPVSADILGVGSDGRTTWALRHECKTAESDHSEFKGTATLVEGRHDASFTYANSAAHFTIGESCTFSEGLAICTAVIGSSTAVQTEAISHVPVQGETKCVFVIPSGVLEHDVVEPSDLLI